MIPLSEGIKLKKKSCQLLAKAGSFYLEQIDLPDQ